MRYVFHLILTALVFGLAGGAGTANPPRSIFGVSPVRDACLGERDPAVAHPLQEVA